MPTITDESVTLDAWILPSGNQYVVWCGHCRKYHLHGMPVGHRAAHCTVPGGPPTYQCMSMGLAPEWLMHDRGLKKPKGPTGRR